MQTKPKLLLFSVEQDLGLLRSIELDLKHTCVVKSWKSLGTPGQYFLDSLYHVDEMDFVGIILGKTETIDKNGDRQNSPPKNLIFELGYSIAKLGSQRVFLFVPSGRIIDLPTNYLGVHYSLYDPTDPQATKQISTEVSHAVEKMGSRQTESWGVTLKNRNEIYQHATNLVEGANEQVYATCFGTKEWGEPERRYLMALATRAAQRLDRDFQHHVIYPDPKKTSKTHLEVAFQTNFEERRKVFDDAGASEALHGRWVALDGGIELLLVDKKHGHISFHLSTQPAIAFGLGFENTPKLIQPISEWYGRAFNKGRDIE